jgi:hypothetical protein
MTAGLPRSRRAGPGRRWRQQRGWRVSGAVSAPPVGPPGPFRCGGRCRPELRVPRSSSRGSGPSAARSRRQDRPCSPGRRVRARPHRGGALPARRSRRSRCTHGRAVPREERRGRRSRWRVRAPRRPAVPGHDRPGAPTAQGRRVCRLWPCSGLRGAVPRDGRGAPRARGPRPPSRAACDRAAPPFQVRVAGCLPAVVRG